MFSLKMKNILIFLFVSIINFSISQECNFKLSGQILDFHDNTSLENAKIKLIGTSKITTSNRDGKYSFNVLCQGTYVIEVSHISCETKT